MKILKLLLLLSLLTTVSLAAQVRSGNDLLAAMQKKYEGKWYKTLTFTQKTINYKPDGTSEAATWYEALTFPGKLRIDFDPVDKRDGIIFADGRIFSFRDGKLAGSRPFVHPLLVLGFDVYFQPLDVTVGQLKSMNIDLSVVHEDEWQGKPVYVVGAKKGDLSTPQFWVDKKDLVFVRLIELAGKDKKSVHESRFNKYVKANGGGLVSTEVEFFVDGKPTTTEEYTEVKTGMQLPSELWDAEKWSTIERTYFTKK